ncbi:MAG: hypothetical protein IKG61_10605 [Selenomonadaceae bacterium]|nr:hypothetical protein [Selenomonadaceae bacterium]
MPGSDIPSYKVQSLVTTQNDYDNALATYLKKISTTAFYKCHVLTFWVINAKFLI